MSDEEIDAIDREARERQGDIDDEVLALNRRILERDPGHAAATNRLANALIKRGMLDEALEVLERGTVANPANQIAARKISDVQHRLARLEQDGWISRSPDVIVEPLLSVEGRAACLSFLATSIAMIQRINSDYLAVTDIPSESRFRVVGGIYSAVTPFRGLLCVSIDRRGNGALIDEIVAAGGEVTDEPGPMSAVPYTVQLGVPQELVAAFAPRLEGPHREHLKASIEYGPPTWQRRHDRALMKYILDQAA